MLVDDYKSEVTEKIAAVRKAFPLQPIVFAGSGLSRRWIGAPSWRELLDWAIKQCPEIDKPLAFFLQQESGNLARVASRIVDDYQSWAWGAGRKEFPDILFEASLPKEVYLKYQICRHLKTFGCIVKKEYQGEADAFAAIRPQSVVTTNYDEMIEGILSDYQPVLGRGLIAAPFASIGEIYKIHGTVDKPSSIVLTSDDYQDFLKRRRYLTAKLLTFFAEHPILFVGYSIEDENIKGVLADLDEATDIPGSIVDNLFVLGRTNGGVPAPEKLVQVSPSKGVRVQSIEADDFEWVFEAFGHSAPLENVNPKVLRAILARAYHLVRKDIPRQRVDVDFDLISRTTESSEEFAKLFGIADLEPATEFSARYPYNLTEVGKKLGFPAWHGANALISRLKDESGIDIKSSDNQYHCKVRISRKSQAHMYSNEALELLAAVRDGQPYSVVADRE